MSDLVPLVAATVKDKVVVDAQSEIAKLRNELKQLTAVEVIRAADDDSSSNKVLVFSSASFQDGEIAREYWMVKLQPGVTPCRLSELRTCRLCVGGGIPMESFGNSGGDIVGLLDRHVGEAWELDYDREERIVHVRFSEKYRSGTFIKLVIKGWPREAIEEEFQTRDIIDYLVDSVAASFPEATVEFRQVLLRSCRIHGVAKRLLPPQQRYQTMLQSRAFDDEVSRNWDALG
mmetsp:Transcript_9604/g.22549  ORF Transcript_9604/g.22549 Transcript_9604/m.22549 type:complete len:232 (+) Transcript_9604:494-1189(+)